MQLEILREFVMLAQYRNFSEAARKLYISQPTLSNHIAALEKELGVTLVEREGLTGLTPAGKAFFEDVSECLERIDRAIERCQDISRSVERGAFVIKSPIGNSEVERHFFRIVSGFKREHPSIDVRFVRGDSRPLLDELVSGTIDCGLFYELPDDLPAHNTPDFVHFHTTSVYAFFQVGHPLEKLERVSLKDLAPYPYPVPSGVRYQEFRLCIDKLFASQGLSSACSYKMVDSFEDFLYSLEDTDVILGAPGGAALEGWSGVPLDPPVEQRAHIGISTTGNSTVRVFKEYLDRNLASFD